MVDKLIRIKWASANTPYLECTRTDERIYLTKRELIDLLREAGEFVEYYLDNFSYDKIDYVDWLDDEGTDDED
jgi:hypothetical protein